VHVPEQNDGVVLSGDDRIPNDSPRVQSPVVLEPLKGNGTQAQADVLPGGSSVLGPRCAFLDTIASLAAVTVWVVVASSSPH